MPEEEFEIRGAHEEALEHAAERRAPLGQQIALFSAILATLGAVASFLGGHTQNEALYHKNEAVLLKARASDAWAYYQAEDLKRHIADLEARLASARPQAAEPSLTEAQKYADRAHRLRSMAEELDRQSAAADAESYKARHTLSLLSLSPPFR